MHLGEAKKEYMDKEKVLAHIEALLDSLHRHQCEKARKIASHHVPNVTSEDLLNPDNFPTIISDPHFMYEDGLAAGILSAKIAVRSTLKENF
jgi:hypothetical protein